MYHYENTLIGDWGFKELSKGNDSVWVISSSDYFTTTFKTELEPGFQDTSIVGYYALMVLPNVLNYVPPETFFINTTIDVPDLNETLAIQFTLSSKYMDYSVFVTVDNFGFFDVEPSLGQYERSTYLVDLPSLGIEPGIHNVSFQINYLESTQTGIAIYIENIICIRTPDETGHVTYVSTQGSDILGDGSLESPFSSIMQAIAYSKRTNSTIYLLPGLYCGQGNSWIDPDGKGITITSYNESLPSILSGQGLLSIVNYESVNVVHTLTMNCLIFEDSSIAQASAISVAGLTSLLVTNSQFRRVSSNAITLSYLINSTFINCTFIDYVDYAISVSGLLGSEVFQCTNCTFNGLQSIFALKMASAEIISSTIMDPGVSGEYGLACGFNAMMIDDLSFLYTNIGMSICVSHANMTLYGCQVASSVYIQEAVILTQSVNLNITSTTFAEFPSPSSVLAFHGEVYIEQSKFLNTGATVSIFVDSSELTVIHSEFVGMQRAIYLDGSSVWIQGSQFTNCQSFAGGSQAMVEIDFCNITRSSLPNTFVKSRIFFMGNNVTDSTSSTFFDLHASNLVIETSRIHDNSFIFAQGSVYSHITIIGTTFARNNHSIVSVTDTSDAVIQTSHVYNTTAQSGGIVLADLDSDVQIISSVFQGSKASYGGVAAIYDNAKLTITKSHLSHGWATQGGVVYTSSKKPVTIQNCLVLGNQAHEGSIVYYTSTPTVLINNDLVNNTQTFGTEIALGRATLIVQSNIPGIIDSGSGGYTITVQLVDTVGNRLSNSFCQTKCMIYLTLNGEFLASLPINSTGEVEFQDLTLIGVIAKLHELTISSNEQTIEASTITITFNHCNRGYSPDPQGTLCQVCASGSYGWGDTCPLCPDNIICQNGTFSPDVGYWIDYIQYNETQEMVSYICPPGLCTGDNMCADSYTGPLCAACVNDTYNCGSGCKKVKGINSLVLVYKIVLLVALVLFQQLSDDERGLVTIVLYFLQNLVVISNGIRFSLLSAFSDSTGGHGPSTSILGMFSDCVAPIGFYWNHYISLMQPIFLFAILAIIIAIELCFRRSGLLFRLPLLKSFVEPSEREFRNRQFSALVKVAVNSFGPFITEVLLILFCHEVGTYSLLNTNPEVTCKGESYTISQRITFGLLPLVPLIPLGVFFLLFRDRHRLADRHVERKLGVFFLKYKRAFYYWDAVLLGKRVFIVTLSLLQYSSSQRSVSLVFLTFASLVLQLKYQPFLSAADNNLETISLTLLFVCCIYLDNDLYETTEQWILVISIIFFIGAAIWLQGYSLWRDYVKPTLERAKRILNSSKSSSNRRRSSSGYKNHPQFSYEDDDDDDTVSINQPDVIGRVDKRKFQLKSPLNDSDEDGSTEYSNLLHN
eukprot:gene1502-1748_t